MKVFLAPEQCVGAGHCVTSAPEVFDQNEDDGVVLLLDDTPDADLADSVHEAADLCPAQAILVGATQGGSTG
ncbi:ferredoxin [Streptomyces sp. ISL-98]|uniref:ferredoxin n=1 Tax=Streptomyces sp. ISL-98 TaxID=2819192 RepID=UPI001BE846C2|nr:ferredoxin [Streptomyces sp. ISL-98]MBT2508655.1 ferredoxin [Streptomyces sp. ISL-98]